jgi:hypothetical protein
MIIKRNYLIVIFCFAESSLKSFFMHFDLLVTELSILVNKELQLLLISWELKDSVPIQHRINAVASEMITLLR